MFDTDSFVADCVRAAGEPDARLAVKEVLARATADPVGDGTGAAPRPRRPDPAAHLARPHRAPAGLGAGDAPRPHDHRMWAAIGIYTGGEDNGFFRRNAVAGPLGWNQLRPGDAALLGHDTIHAVANPSSEFTGVDPRLRRRLLRDRAQRVELHPLRRAAVRRRLRAPVLRRSQPHPHGILNQEHRRASDAGR